MPDGSLTQSHPQFLHFDNLQLINFASKLPSHLAHVFPRYFTGALIISPYSTDNCEIDHIPARPLSFDLSELRVFHYFLFRLLYVVFVYGLSSDVVGLCVSAALHQSRHCWVITIDLQVTV